MDTTLPRIDENVPTSQQAVNRLAPRFLPEFPWLRAALIVLSIIIGVGLAFVAVHWSFTYALLAVLLVVAGVVVVRKPELGLFLIILAIPLEDFNKLDVLGSLSIVKLLSIGAMGAYLLHVLLINPEERLVASVQNVFVGALFLIALASNFIAVDLSGSLAETFKLFRMIAFYFTVINIVRTDTALKNTFLVIVLAGIFPACYGLYEYFFQPQTLVDMRVSGTLDDPVGFAYTMVVLLPFVWYMLKHHHNPLLRIILAGAGMLFLYAIILSGTRSGILGAACVLVLIALREKYTLVSLLVLAVLFIGGMLFMPEQVKSRLGLDGQVDQSAQASTERRTSYLTYGIQLFLEKPILGTGLSGFRANYANSEFQFYRGEEGNRVAHNMYLEIATGLGLVGFIPFLLVCGFPLLQLQRVAKEAAFRHVSDMAQAIAISLIAYLFIGAFGSLQYDKSLWLVIGLATVVPFVMKYSESEAETGA